MTVSSTGPGPQARRGQGADRHWRERNPTFGGDGDVAAREYMAAVIPAGPEVRAPRRRLSRDRSRVHARSLGAALLALAVMTLSAIAREVTAAEAWLFDRINGLPDTLEWPLWVVMQLGGVNHPGPGPVGLRHLAPAAAGARPGGGLNARLGMRQGDEGPSGAGSARFVL